MNERKVLLGVMAVAGVALLGSTTEAKPKKKPAQVAPVSSAAAPEESVAEKEKWAKQDYYMRRDDNPVQTASEACGITDKSKHLTYAWDKASFNKDKSDDWSSHSPNGYCGAAFDNIGSVCRNMEAAKDPVQRKIKRVVCRLGGKGNFGVTLSNGTLVYSIDWDQANADDMFKARLKQLI